MSSGSEHGIPSRKIVSTRVYESSPAIPSQQEVVSTTQTEEWTTKKKTDKLITKQIKTRVKREIVMTEDGEIIEDSGPLVTTDTTEETKTDEQEDVEHKTSGLGDPGPGWKVVPGSKVVQETKKYNTTSHETKEEKNESEITEEVGGLTREDITRALKYKDLAAIKVRRDSSSTNDSRPKLQSSRSHKVVDTEEVDEVSEFKDGHLSTETRKKSNREEHFDGDEITSSEDEVDKRREPIIEKKSWSALTADERRRQSPSLSSDHSSSSKNVKFSHKEAADSRPSSRDTNNSSREKVRATSPTFNSSHLQQVDHRKSTPSPQSRVYQVWTEEEDEESTRKSSRVNSRNRIQEEDGQEQTENRNKTFKWVENHFGSQDFEDSGIITEASTNESPTLSKEYYIPITCELDGSTHRRVHHSKRQQMPTEKKVKYKAPEPPIPPLTSSRLSFEKDNRPSSRSTTKTNSHWTSTSSSSGGANVPKKQYFLGEDPGFGQRFTGMIDVCNRKSPEESLHNTDSAYSTLSLSRPTRSNNRIIIDSPQQKCSTLGRPPDLHFKDESFNNHTNNHNNTTNGNKINKKLLINDRKLHSSSNNVDTNSTPSVADIIHSLRSKEFLEKENSAVSIRDDDSVFDIRSVSHFQHHNNNNHHHHRPSTLNKHQYQPATIITPSATSTLTRNKPASKQHVIKITINSDGSECSSPVDSPRIIKNGSNNNNNHTSSQQFNYKIGNEDEPVLTGKSSGRDSIVKNAINNLMKSQHVTDYPYNSLSRTSSPRNNTNLTKSKVYLAASSPNVSKLVSNEPEIYSTTKTTSKKDVKYHNKPVNNHFNGNNRSVSINNLHSNNVNDDWSPQQPYSNGNQHVYYPQQNERRNSQNLNNGRTAAPQYRSSDWSESYARNYRSFNKNNNNVNKYVPYSPPMQDYSPPSSPTNYSSHHTIKLPSPVPPPQSRSSSSPPSSPLPKLTRPFSPNFINGRDYVTGRTTMRRTPSFNSRSPSPPPPSFVRRPPSPVLPLSSKKRASSIGDDAASSISGRSQSTNCTGSVGSRAGNSSDISSQSPTEKVVTTSRRKVTTTTTKKREIEQPENDYYYENAITGSLNKQEPNNRINTLNRHNSSNNNSINRNGIRLQKEYR